MEPTWFKQSVLKNFGVIALPSGSLLTSFIFTFPSESIVEKCHSLIRVGDAAAGNNYLLDHYVLIQGNNVRLSYNVPNVSVIDGADNTAINIYLQPWIAGNQNPDIAPVKDQQYLLSFWSNQAINFAAVGNTVDAVVWLYVRDP